jgi:TatD DNase family protein
MWIDSHAHLNDDAFQDDLRQVMEEMTAQNIIAVIVPGYDLLSSERAVELAAKEPRLWAAVGIHPHDAKCWGPHIAARLEELLREPKVVAVGEIGLDYHYNYSAREEQLTAFDAQLHLAGQYNKPVIIHNREAHQDTLETLTRFVNRRQHSNTGQTASPSVIRGVMHCYSGSLETALQCLQLGLMISFAGAITFNNATKLREVAKNLPLSKLLVETDAPYLSPHPFRGRRNEPARVAVVGTKLAEIKGLTVPEVMDATTANCMELFGIQASNDC